MLASDKLPPMDRNAPHGRHAVFAGQAHADLLAAGAARMASHTKHRRGGHSRRSSVNT
jgi:hypothetical protein